MPLHRLIALAGMALQGIAIEDLTDPARVADAPSFCMWLATSVMEVRYTPSISARNSCVRYTVLPSARLAECSSQRQHLASTGCTALYAAVIHEHFCQRQSILPGGNASPLSQHLISDRV